jgi:hypothetical protein
MVCANELKSKNTYIHKYINESINEEEKEIK